MARIHTDPNVQRYGFTAVPRDPDILFKDHPTASGPTPKQDPFTAADFPLPESPLVTAVKHFTKERLPAQTFNHSHRVFVYGSAVVRTHFPAWKLDLETYYLTCLLHDIGTADAFLATTKMSFEFKGALVARDLILQHNGVEDQADGVCEAIIRHQDIFVNGGNITMLGQVLQIATIIDNIGLRANLLHPNLIATTCSTFPRNGWSECFARTIEAELALKPWCHTSTFEVPGWTEGVRSNFATDVRGNELMNQFD